MHSIRRIFASAAVLAASILAPALACAQSNYAGQVGTITPNYRYVAQNFTATAQSGSVACNTVVAGTPCVIGLAGASSGTIVVKGTAITTVTFAIQGSNDGGITFFPLLTAPIAAPSTTALTETATANSLYVVDLAGLTNVKFVTSGTFTATGLQIELTATSNKGLL